MPRFLRHALFLLLIALPATLVFVGPLKSSWAKPAKSTAKTTHPGAAKPRPKTKAQVTAKLNEMLFTATETNNVRWMEKLLRQGANANVRSDSPSPVAEGPTPLFKAIAHKSPSAVRTLISHGANVNIEADDDEFTGPDEYLFMGNFSSINPLELAAKLNQVEIIKLLLAAGAEKPTIKNPTLAMSYAAAFNSLAAARVLLDAGISPRVRWEEGEAPLIYAASQGHLEMVKLLISKGAELNVRGWRNETALVQTIDRFQFDIALTLLKAGASPNVADENGQTPLMRLCQLQLPNTDTTDLSTVPPEQRKEAEAELRTWSERTQQAKALVHALVAKGADPNRLPPKGYLPLLIAVDRGAAWLTTALLEAGADPKRVQQPFPSALRLLCQRGRAGTLDDYLRQWTDGTLAVEERETLLKQAEASDVATAKMMLDKGVDLKSGDNRYALAEAARRGHGQMVKLLLEHGADPEVTLAPEKYVLTPWERMQRQLSAGQASEEETERNKYFAQAIKEQAAATKMPAAIQVGDWTYYGGTPLLLAATAGSLDGVQALLAAGADTSKRDLLGNNALCLLAVGGRTFSILQLENSFASISRGSRNMELAEYAIVAPLPEKQTKDLLQWAAQGDGAIASALVARGCPVNPPEKREPAPLRMAALSSSPTVVDVLLKAGAVTDASPDNEPLMMQVITKGRRQSRVLPATTILQLVFKQMEEIESNRPYYGSKKKPAYLITEEKEEKTRFAAIRTEMYRQRRQLLSTWGQQDAAVVSLLLKNGMKVDERDQYGLTPLMRAARLGHIEAARILLDAGADANATDKDGATVMMQVVSHGLRSGALEVPTPPINSLLIPKVATKGKAAAKPKVPRVREVAIRATWGREDAVMVALLLEHGADRQLKDARGRTAVDLAKQLSHPEALALFNHTHK